MLGIGVFLFFSVQFSNCPKVEIIFIVYQLPLYSFSWMFKSRGFLGEKENQVYFSSVLIVLVIVR